MEKQLRRFVSAFLELLLLEKDCGVYTLMYSCICLCVSFVSH